MPRQRRRKNREATSSHFTSVDIHQLRRKVIRANRVTAKSLVGELLRLGRHLCQNCDPCWQAVEQLSPPFKPCLGEPVTDAIARLANVKGRLTVAEEHRQALREVRLRPYGFAYVVFEEALAQGLARAVSEGKTAPDPEVYRFWADQLLEELAKTAPGATPELADVTVYSACDEAEIHLMGGETDAAQKCVEDIHDVLPATTGRPFVQVRALEVEAQLNEVTSRFPQADECYRLALDLLGPDQARRRFEIRSESVELLFRRKASPEQLYMAFADALAELPPDCAEPAERLFMVHDLARATRRLAQLARDAGLRKWPGIPEALQALEQARPLYLEQADRFAREMAETLRTDLEDLVTDLAPMPAN